MTINHPDIVVTAPRYRQINERGLALILRRESFRALAYDDQQPKRTVWGNTSQVRGVPTIGYGHTKGVSKGDIIARRTCTKEQAMQWKRDDLDDAYAKIERVMGREGVYALSDCQYSAIVSFVFNCGLNGNWQIAKLLKQKRFNEVPDQMIRFVFDDGKRLQGLVDRRREEIDLFRMDEVVSVGAANPTGVVTAQPTKSLLASRTFLASMLAAFSGMGGAITAATESLTPYADNPIVHAMIVVFTIVGTLSGFYAAFLKMQDQMGARA